jgi:hypothetical protein
VRCFQTPQNMKLTIRRNQADVKGMFGGHKGVKFSLYGKCEVTDAEKALIAKYKVGEYVLAHYEVERKGGEPFDYRITVDRIIAGDSFETDDVQTLQELEKAMKEGCQNLKDLLEVMSTFGGEEVFEI